MVEPTHDDPEVPEADEIEQLTAVAEPAPGETDVPPQVPDIPLEAPEADVLEQARPVPPEDEYPPA